MDLERQNIAQVKWGRCCCILRLAQGALKSTPLNDCEPGIGEQPGWCLLFLQTIWLSSFCCPPWRLTSVDYPTRVSLSSGFTLGLVNKKPQQLMGGGRKVGSAYLFLCFLLEMLLWASSVTHKRSSSPQAAFTSDPLLPHSNGHCPSRLSRPGGDNWPLAVLFHWATSCGSPKPDPHYFHRVLL